MKHLLQGLRGVDASGSLRRSATQLSFDRNFSLGSDLIKPWAQPQKK